MVSSNETLQNKKFKVLIFTHYFPAHRGGIEKVCEEITNRMVKNYPIELSWISSNQCHYPQVDNIQCYSVQSNNFLENKFGIPYPIWNISSIKSINSLIKNVDLVHIHDYIYMGNLLGFILTKINKKPVVITQHIGLVPYNNPFLRLLFNLLNKTLGKIILRLSNKTIFISTVVKKYFYGDIPPIKIIPNGVSHTTYLPLSTSERVKAKKKLNLPMDKKVLLFVGRFVEKKGLHIIKSLASQLNDFHFILIGKGVITPSKWNLNNVNVLEFMEKEQIVSYYQAADLFILPSKGEGFPLVIQESMACGTPVLTSTENSEAGNVPNNLIFTESVFGKNVNENWKFKINDIFNNYDELISLREKVVEFTKKEWSWEETCKQYYKIYNEVIA